MKKMHFLQSLNPTLQLLQLPRPPPLQYSAHRLPSSPSPTTKWTCKLSRRDLSLASTVSSASLVLLSALLSTSSPSPANADDDQASTTTIEEDTTITTSNTPSSSSNVEADSISTSDTTTASTTSKEADSITTTTTDTTGSGCINQTVTKKAYLDVAIDGRPAGRIVIGLYGDGAPFGSSRFAALVSGSAGISYRRKEFIKIVPNYVQHGGVRSYGVDAELAKQTDGSGLAADSLVAEWERSRRSCPGSKNVATSLGLVVRDPARPPPKLKLVARQGKLVIDEEEVGVAPNGTEFVIAVKESPELDESTLVIGKVLDGIDVVEKISQVKTVKENTSSPYFRVAKLIGDQRAVVAERGFNRPYSKVIVTNCGLL